MGSADASSTLSAVAFRFVVLLAVPHSLVVDCSGTGKVRDNENVFRPDDNVLDAAALERFIVNRTRGQRPSAGQYFNLSVLAGRYFVAGPDRPGGYGRCAAHLCFGFLDPLLPNVSLNMTAVTLVLEQRDRAAVVVQDAHRFALLGLRTMYQATPTNQAVVIGIGRNNPGNRSLTVRVEDGYPSTDWTSSGKPFPCGVFAPDVLGWRPGTGMLTYTAIDRARGSRDRIFTLFFDAGTLPSIGFEQIERGDLLGCRPRDTDYTFVVRNCSGCTFDSITLLGGPGFGFFEDGGGTLSNKFLRCRISPPPKPAGAVHAPVLSTAADGLHSSQASVGPIIENCIFDRMGDDGVAIHGSYHLVVASPNSTTVIVAAGSWTHTSVQVGDRLWLYDPSLRPTAELEVASWMPMASSYLPPGNPASRSLPKHYHQAGPFVSVRLSKTLPLADDLSDRVGFDWLVSNANRTGASFTLRNNTVRDNHARAVNLKASGGVVVNNVFSGNFHGGIVVAPELYWGEADYSRNLRIESNVVTNVGFAKWSYGAIGVGATIPHGQKGNGGGTTFASGGGHRVISIVGNRIVDCDTWGIWVSSSANVLVQNNDIVRPWHHSTWATYPPPYPVPARTVVFITESTGVAVKGNCVLNAGPFTKRLFNSTVTLQPGSQHSWHCNTSNGIGRGSATDHLNK